MNLSWFKNPDNVVFADADTFIKDFGEEAGIENLRKKLEDFHKNPTKEGLQLIGKKRTSMKAFIPDLVFDEHIEMGDKVWIYMGENYECYCLHNLGEQVFHMDTEEYKFFQHRNCEFFPCHKTNDEDNFNCLFCYCPLYAMGRDCGGAFKYTENGVKDCSACLIPHKKGNYDYMMKKIQEFYATLQAKELELREQEKKAEEKQD